MSSLGVGAFGEIRQWIYRNARPVDFTRWQYHFESGNGDSVAKALAAYQNQDGGFGHALDGGSWNPNSSPRTAAAAVRILREVNLYSYSHPVVMRLLVYLSMTPYYNAYGWPLSIPSDWEHPHAAWMECEGNEDSFALTGYLVGYILRCGSAHNPFYAEAEILAKSMIGKLYYQKALDSRELASYCSLLEDIRAADLMQQFDGERFLRRLHMVVSATIQGGIATDTPSVGSLPLACIPSPESPLYEGNGKIVSRALDTLIKARQPGGIWDIPAAWGGYAQTSVIGGRWQQADLAIRNVLLLKSYGRLIPTVMREYPGQAT